MQLQTRAFPSTLIYLVLLSQTSFVIATEAQASCLHQRSVDFSKAAACGDKGSLQYCFQNSPDYVSWSSLEQCFEKSGCTLEEARIEASFIVRQCDERSSEAELRRRITQPMAARTVAPLLARAETTTTTTAQSSITCSTETVITTNSCPIQSTGTASGETLSCFETAVTTKVCAAGIICKEGTDICMVREDAVTGAALFFAILLATVLGSGIITLLVLCCLDKRRRKRAHAQKDAALTAKIDAANNSSAPARPQRPLRSPSANSHLSGDPFVDPHKTGH